ncbi:LOW QUALITY PROTEIN: hypothetical protein ACHAXA_011104, partial [Cyclostephanos tholiformis]
MRTHCGAPVKFSTPPWTSHQVQRALSRGPHKSAHEYIDYLGEEFVDMINKGQWVILPYSAVQHLPGLRISPPGVIPQRGRRPRWIVDYSWWDVNADTLPLAAMELMQFGHALERIRREILLANPDFGPVYSTWTTYPNLVWHFQLLPGTTPWWPSPWFSQWNSPPIFSSAIGTIVDMVNSRIARLAPALPHHLNDLAESIPSTNPPHVTLRCPSYRSHGIHHSLTRLHPSLTRTSTWHRVDRLAETLSETDSMEQREPVSLKKLHAGDCSWRTMKLVLGWIIDTINMTISLPQHRVDRLAEILHSFPVTQQRTSVKRWHETLGELRSMALALSGARNVFSAMQNALSTQSKGRVALRKCVHDALDDFLFMHQKFTTRPTSIAELVPLPPVAIGHHDVSGSDAGGIWFPGPSITPRVGIPPIAPVVWRHMWPDNIRSRLITDAHPS